MQSTALTVMRIKWSALERCVLEFIEFWNLKFSELLSERSFVNELTKGGFKSMVLLLIVCHSTRKMSCNVKILAHILHLYLLWGPSALCALWVNCPSFFRSSIKYFLEAHFLCQYFSWSLLSPLTKAKPPHSLLISAIQVTFQYLKVHPFLLIFGYFFVSPDHQGWHIFNSYSFFNPAWMNSTYVPFIFKNL